MTGDHLSARQVAGNYIAQNSLTTTSTCYYRTPMPHNGATTWADREAAGHGLARAGRRGTWLDNEKVILGHVGFGPRDLTVEIVHAPRSGESYNFFGGTWSRETIEIYGWYAYVIRIWHAPVNDSISDTTGRFIFDTSDVGANRIASRTVYSRPVVSDNTPHHVCFTHSGTALTDAVKLYVDGVLTEKYSLTYPMADFQANSVIVGVEDFFTSGIGSYSHACVTQGILATSEIAARSNLISNLSDAGTALAWGAALNKWLPVQGHNGTKWRPVTGL